MRRYTPKEIVASVQDSVVGAAHSVPTKKLGYLFPVLIGFAISTLMLVVMSVACCAKSEATGEDAAEKPIAIPPSAMDEDLYGMTITSIVHDLKFSAKGTEAKYVRLSRIGVSLIVLVFSMIIQLYVMYGMKRLVSAASVHDIRHLYGHYQFIMYGKDESHLVKSVNGFYRGKEEFFRIENFGMLGEDDKAAACRISFSQPTFLMTVLLIWSYTVIADIRKVAELSYRMCVVTPTIASMEEALQPLDGDGADGNVVIAGLTPYVKATLMSVMFIPRFLVDCCLLWLGTRWLVATIGFENVLVNTVALEFILHVSSILFSSMVPNRNKVETARTYVKPMAAEEDATPWTFLGTFFWGIGGMVWVLLYMYWLQEVLPDYQWDVQDACADYLEKLSAMHSL